jgi:hypothetical protein
MSKYYFVLLCLLFVRCASAPDTPPTKDAIEVENNLIFTNAHDFNDYLSIRVNTVHELLEQLQYADEQDDGAGILIQLSNESQEIAEVILTELSDLISFGEYGAELLQLTIAYIESKITIMAIYAEFAAQLAIPESEWTNEDFDAWMSGAEPYFGVSDQIMHELLDMQQTYLSAN